MQDQAATKQKRKALEHVISRVPTASPQTFVREILQNLRSSEWDSMHYIYVLDRERLVGVVSIRKLLQANDDATLGSLMQEAPGHVTDASDQEHIAVRALHLGLKSVPVLERQTGKFLGAVPSDTILKILHEEHVEDLLRSAGIQRTENITDVFRTSLLRLVRLRIGWLLVGLLGGMLSTFLVKSFEGELQANLALAFFIPVLVYMSDAVGTQTETLFIRSLIMKHAPFAKTLLRELAVGALLGMINGLFLFAFAYLLVHSLPIATTVALTMFLSVFLSTGLAMTIPSILLLLKRDAALGSGPLATVLQDLLTLLIYFAVATLILG